MVINPGRVTTKLKNITKRGRVKAVWAIGSPGCCDAKIDRFDWPPEPGIWMGNTEINTWFPFIAKLQDDQIVVSYPESEENWPFLSQADHPVNKWMETTDTTLKQAKEFYTGNLVAETTKPNRH